MASQTHAGARRSARAVRSKPPVVFEKWYDAYNRAEVNDEDQYVFIRLKPKSPVSPARFECIDFVGMTHDEIENAFKTWGDPNAAARGKSNKNILGGHGNGGKFYMRQMFGESRFITYRDG